MTVGKLKATAWSLAALLGLWACSDSEETWRQDRVLTGLPVHGLQGLAFGPDGALYLGSVMSEAVVQLDLASGEMTEAVGPPLGEADDVAFGPGGTMAWTAINQGALRLRTATGGIETVAEGLPFVNPVTFGPDGTLYAATLFGPDRLWAYNLTEGSARVVTENIGGLNGFEFGGDGLLYTPLPMRQAIGRIDVATGALEVITEDAGDIVGVAWHPDGSLYGVSWSDGRVLQIDTAGGTVRTVATVEPPLDNLAIGEDGTIYVTRSSDNGVIAVDLTSGAQTTVVRSDLAAPGGMTWVTRNGRRQLLVTDIFGYRFFDPATSAIELLPFDLEKRASSDADVRNGKIALSYVRRNRALLLDETSGEMLLTWTEIDAPYGILIEPSGDVITALHKEGTLVRLSPDGDAKPETVAAGLEGPVGLAWADDTAVFVVESAAGRISRVTLTTGAREIIVAGLAQPETVKVMSDGRIAVAEVGARRILAIRPQTGERTVLADGLAIGGPISRAPDPVAMPTGLAVDETGAIWVATDAENGLIKLSLDM